MFWRRSWNHLWQATKRPTRCSEGGVEIISGRQPRGPLDALKEELKSSLAGNQEAHSMFWRRSWNHLWQATKRPTRCSEGGVEIISGRQPTKRPTRCSEGGVEIISGRQPRGPLDVLKEELKSSLAGNQEAHSMFWRRSWNHLWQATKRPTRCSEGGVQIISGRQPRGPLDVLKEELKSSLAGNQEAHSMFWRRSWNHLWQATKRPTLCSEGGVEIISGRQPRGPLDVLKEELKSSLAGNQEAHSMFWRRSWNHLWQATKRPTRCSEGGVWIISGRQPRGSLDVLKEELKSSLAGNQEAHSMFWRRSWNHLWQATKRPTRCSEGGVEIISGRQPRGPLDALKEELKSSLAVNQEAHSMFWRRSWNHLWQATKRPTRCSEGGVEIISGRQPRGPLDVLKEELKSSLAGNQEAYSMFWRRSWNHLWQATKRPTRCSEGGVEIISGRQPRGSLDVLKEELKSSLAGNQEAHSMFWRRSWNHLWQATKRPTRCSEGGVEIISGRQPRGPLDALKKELKSSLAGNQEAHSMFWRRSWNHLWQATKRPTRCSEGGVEIISGRQPRGPLDALKEELKSSLAGNQEAHSMFWRRSWNHLWQATKRPTRCSEGGVEIISGMQPRGPLDVLKEELKSSLAGNQEAHSMFWRRSWNHLWQATKRLTRCSEGGVEIISGRQPRGSLDVLKEELKSSLAGNQEAHSMFWRRS